MITDEGKNWHYLTVISISRLFKGITSNHHGDFYCLNCFYSYTTTTTTKKRLTKHEKICKDHGFCHIIMPDEENKILKYNSGEKSLKVPFIIYISLKCSPKKTDIYYSRVTCCYFDKLKTEHSYYRGKEDCKKNFCKDLRDQAIKIIDYRKKEIIPLAKEEQGSYEEQKVCYICKK